MDEQTCKNLSELAKRVRNLVDDPAVKNQFREHLRNHNNDCLAWHEQNDNYKQEVSELRESIFGGGSLQESSEQVKKKKEEEFQKKLKIIDKKYPEIKGPSPTDKLFLSLPEYRDINDFESEMVLHILYPSGTPDRLSYEQKVRMSYVLLTVLHDKKYESDHWITPISEGIWSLSDDWIEELWKEMVSASSAIAGGDAEFFDRIKNALKLVKKDLQTRENIVLAGDNDALGHVKADMKEIESATEFMPREVQLMELIVKELKIWFQDAPGDENYPSGTVALRNRNHVSLAVEFLYLDEVLTRLRVNNHKEIARSLEQERDRFLSDLQAVEQTIEIGEGPLLDLIELRSKITGLIGKLEDTAAAFKDKLKSEKSAEKKLQVNDGMNKGGKEQDPIQATPETDSTLIYQADASTFYNIPKATLSKASKKKPGEPGYLWSGRKGKRVFYRKNDCNKIAKSRTKLRNI